MKVLSSQNPIVDALYGLELKGNIIPEAWFKTICMPNGKPDSVGIFLLSEILYWYRPTVTKDEYTGEVIALEKKFHEDLLQKSYAQLHEKFGFTEKQIRDAIVRLEKIGVIKRVLRTVTSKGQLMNNVMYLELFPDKLKELTCTKSDEDVPIPTNITGAPYKDVDRVSTNMETGAYIIVETNTENTTEITNTDYPIISISEARSKFKGQIGYDALIIDHPFKVSAINELVEVASEILSSRKKMIKVAGEKRFIEDIQERFNQLNIHHMKYILESLENHASAVKDMKAFLITAMFNAPATMDNHYTAKVNHDMRTA